MPIEGGLPTRWTFEGEGGAVIGWTPEGEVLYATTRYSTLPSTQLVRLPVTGQDAGRRRIVPLAQAADGSFDDRGQTLYFTRLPFQGSHTKRYKGGTAQNVWRFAKDAPEATPLSSDWPGTTSNPLWFRGRLIVVTDRDGTKNLWSMSEDGGDLRQLTRHRGWDVASPTLSQGKVVYQLGADLRDARCRHRRGPRHPDPAGHRPRPGARAVGGEAVRLADRLPPLSRRQPGRPDGARQGLRRAASAGTAGAGDARGRRAVARGPVPRRQHDRRPVRCVRRGGGVAPPRQRGRAGHHAHAGRDGAALGSRALAGREAHRPP